eukprot:1766638-Rhodomonas_salina.2
MHAMPPHVCACCPFPFSDDLLPLWLYPGPGQRIGGRMRGQQLSRSSTSKATESKVPPAFPRPKLSIFTATEIRFQPVLKPSTQAHFALHKPPKTLNIKRMRIQLIALPFQVGS